MRFAFLLALLLATTGVTAAPDYPTKPIRLVVGFPPGGAVDIIARTISEPLGKRLGQLVIVENRSGAGGNIGAADVARADPDGHTLLIGAASSLAISASLYNNLQYSLLQDLAPVAVVASVPNVLVVNNAVKAHSVQEVITLAKSEPGRLNFGSAGTGTTVHFSGELFKSMAGINIAHVPYKGAAPAMNDLLGGHVDMMFDFLSAAGPQIKAGRLRALGVTSNTRSALFPDIPTIAEAGLPGYEVKGYFGIFTRAGTPESIIETLNREIAAVVAMPDMERKLAEQSATPMTLTPSAFTQELQEDVAKWAKVVEATGLKLN
ncbi:MAG: tripartite tricarboxylate transporter substrate binding protein [Pusillimonas sp.]